MALTELLIPVSKPDVGDSDIVHIICCLDVDKSYQYMTSLCGATFTTNDPVQPQDQDCIVCQDLSQALVMFNDKAFHVCPKKQMQYCPF